MSNDFSFHLTSLLLSLSEVWLMNMRTYKKLIRNLVTCRHCQDISFLQEKFNWENPISTITKAGFLIYM